jgi:hypothetical protein
MTLGGWIVMCLSVGGVTLFLGWCIRKVFATPGAVERIHSQADIETPDITEQ